MKKLFYLSTLLLLSLKLWAQCTPEASLTHSGFYPDKLPHAIAELAYSQVVTFKIPSDTVVMYNNNPVNVHVDSAKLLLLKGVPPGFGYACLNRCVVPSGGRGCALLSGTGTTAQIGSYPVYAFLQTYFKVSGIPISRIDSTAAYTFYIDAPAPVGMKTAQEEKFNFGIYPNPASTEIRVVLNDAEPLQGARLHIYNSIGVELLQTELLAHAQSVNLQQLPAGLYICVLEHAGHSTHRSLLKQ